MTKYTETKKQKLRPEKPEPKPLVKTIVAATSVLSAGLFGMAAPGLLDSETTADFVKIGLFTISAGVVIYGVNTVGLTKGAPLCAVGSKFAGLASVCAIALVGTGLFMSTYAGLVRHKVTELRLQEHGNALTAYVNAQYTDALETNRVIPVIRTNAADRQGKFNCEVDSACVSQNGKPGKGRVAEILLAQVKRSSTVAAEVEQGQAELQAGLRRANAKLSEYRETAVNTDLSAKDRKIRLQQISAALKEASPHGLLRAYLAELDNLTAVQGNPVATRTINALNRKYSGNLRSVFSVASAEETAPPVYPARTGVAETLSWNWLSYFFPIAIFVGTLELVWPLLI